jgi:hypothetical protein
MIVFSPAVISDRLQALTRALDLDPTLPGRLSLMSAPIPAAGQPPVGSQVLAVATFPKPSLSHVSANVLTLLNPATSLVTVTGEAAWARLENGSNQWVADLDVGVAGSGAAVILDNGSNTLMLFAGGEFSVTLAKLQES